MELANLAASRPAWIDRNPSPQGIEYEGINLAPHINTLRVSYTVAAGKKAQVEGLSIDICRVTAAAPVGLYQAYWYLVTSGGNCPMPRVKMLTNNIGDRAGALANGSMFMGAGDQVQGVTGDAGTGGTVNYTIGLKATQYDA